MKTSLTLALLSALPLAACARTGEIDATGGISAVRSVCPAVGVAAGTGDITVFDPPASRDQSAIDVSATLTNLRSTCNDAGEQIATTLTFDVLARRARGDGARQVVLPYYIAVVRGGSAVTAKRIGRVAVDFAAGQTRAMGRAQATSYVSRAAATLPPAIRQQLTRRRKAGDEDAAVDPLTQPEIRQAVLSASFEALVGFQLTAEQLRYNATR
ncbi:hypothetical protein [uncultured Sphingomonas sp.]|uniref:hypothetical protein n=1 Tax=uncultured Sphingomonas sp. TaxID=158754 RepID=UPI0035CBB47B